MSERSLIDNKKVLIVDDEPDVLETLVELLYMCDVVPATNYEQAKELLATQHFDIAILDIMGVDGYGLLEIANNNKVISVMLTAHALSPESIVKSYKEGAASYVPKDEMSNITTFLEDILEAKEGGKSTWTRWFHRLGHYLDRKFGPDWQKDDRDFWDKFIYY